MEQKMKTMTTKNILPATILRHTTACPNLKIGCKKNHAKVFVQFSEKEGCKAGIKTDLIFLGFAVILYS